MSWREQHLTPKKYNTVCEVIAMSYTEYILFIRGLSLYHACEFPKVSHQCPHHISAFMEKRIFVSHLTDWCSGLLVVTSSEHACLVHLKWIDFGNLVHIFPLSEIALLHREYALICYLSFAEEQIVKAVSYAAFMLNYSALSSKSKTQYLVSCCG